MNDPVIIKLRIGDLICYVAIARVIWDIAGLLMILISNLSVRQ